jgi:hypothetical protein
MLTINFLNQLKNRNFRRFSQICLNFKTSYQIPGQKYIVLKNIESDSINKFVKDPSRCWCGGVILRYALDRPWAAVERRNDLGSKD